MKVGMPFCIGSIALIKIDESILYCFYSTVVHTNVSPTVYVCWVVLFCF